MLNKAEGLKVRVMKSPLGATIIDCGVETEGSIEAGLLLTEICLAGLARTRLISLRLDDVTLPAVLVSTDSPALACLGSQMAGWQIKIGGYEALGSGPARALAKKPPEVYAELEHEEGSEEAVLVLESRALPSDEVLRRVAAECGVKPANLYALVVSVSSLAGSTQVAGRCTEAGLHKMRRLNFDVRKVRRAEGKAPIAPVVKDELVMMGRVNDSILLAGRARYTVDAEGTDVAGLACRIPSSTSPYYGKPFFEILRSAGFDFYKIDPDIFSVAQVELVDLSTGKKYSAGAVDVELLKKSWGAG
jgi:methenyltetrahydromethanopterin cyclohydrolase